MSRRKAKVCRSITIPADLQEKLQLERRDVNVSGVCTAALQRAVDEEPQFDDPRSKSIESMADEIKRLRAELKVARGKYGAEVQNLRKDLARAEEQRDEALQKCAGPTGEYPRGKIKEDDEGELQIRIGRLDDCVVMDFGKPTAWVAFPPKQALDIAESLQIWASRVENWNADTEDTPQKSLRCECLTWAWAPEMGPWTDDGHHPNCVATHPEGCDCRQCNFMGLVRDLIDGGMDGKD